MLRQYCQFIVHLQSVIFCEPTDEPPMGFLGFQKIAKTTKYSKKVEKKREI